MWLSLNNNFSVICRSIDHGKTIIEKLYSRNLKFRSVKLRYKTFVVELMVLAMYDLALKFVNES